MRVRNQYVLRHYGYSISYFFFHTNTSWATEMPSNMNDDTVCATLSIHFGKAVSLTLILLWDRYLCKLATNAWIKTLQVCYVHNQPNSFLRKLHVARPSARVHDLRQFVEWTNVV